MATKLIRLGKDVEGDASVLIEVEAPQSQFNEISARTAAGVDATLDKIQPLLVKACHPVIAALKEISEEANVEKAEVQISFSFEAGGNVYITKFSTTANLTVKLELKPKG